MLVESLSGIRGIFGTDLTENVVRTYGRAFALRIKKLNGTSVVIGYDTRPSSERIATIMKEECAREELDVFDCGVSSTAAMHIAVTTFQSAGGVMVTASHNEPEWNGMKFLRSDGALLHPDEAATLTNDAHTTELAHGDVDISGAMDVSRRLVQEYVLLLLRTIGDKAREELAERHLHILVDANGGAALPYLKEFFDRLNIEVTYKGDQAGKFWRTVEPKAESLAPLVDMLEIGKEDFAIAFDCDADRMEFVMPKISAFAKRGTPFVSGQYVLGLVVKAVLSTWDFQAKQKPIVVTNNATSNLVSDIVETSGGALEEVDVGEINVVKRMQETESPVGGEGSSAGGIIPPMTGRDGLMTLAVILRYLAETGKTMDEALLDIPEYTTLQSKIAVAPDKAQAVRVKLIEYMKTKCKDVRVFGDDGGVKCVTGAKQFMTFRMSKTEAGVYRVIADAREGKDAEALLARGEKLLKKLSK